MRVRADREVCVGAGMCALTAPEVFDQDDGDGRVVLLAPVPPPGLRGRAAEAAGLCPSGAITVSDT
ncbi:ferredoxin [Nocardiopsis changdeensis]|uniref:Ferredoxin n=1 Tax=Nocardiopsis changdeensis TaxID=2831969 RepID=A0ABX8BTB8_9ACTN|nr:MULTISPECIES: ferredoxin [Nocardiopsis]QUX25257.1 ferredoxin [Nocardiopsis changdeensis]QYX35644.1 ferredoxin [Nocardiopsis sp. MT53]